MKEICFISAVILFASCEVCYDETYTYSLQENSEIIKYLDTAYSEYDSSVLYINWKYETLDGEMTIAKAIYIGEHCKNTSDYAENTLRFQFDPDLNNFYFTDSAIINSICHYSSPYIHYDYFVGFISGQKVNNYSWFIEYELSGRSSPFDGFEFPISGKGYFQSAIY